MSDTNIAFSPPGRLLAVGGIYGDVRLWDVTTRRRSDVTITGPRVPVTDLAFSSDGAVLATAHQRTKRIEL